MLAVKQVSANYDGAIIALDEVDVAVSKGQIVALLGPNGAGKTTLLKAIAGMLPFDRGDVVSGDIRFENVSLLGCHPAAISQRGIALVQDGRQCFRELTVRENLRAASFVHPKDVAQRQEMVVSYFPFLSEMMERRAGLLSGGQLQMLVIGMALMCNPRLLLLDEPSLGLSPVMVQSVFDAVERLHRELGMTIIVAEQTVPRLLKIAAEVFVLSRGKIVMHTSPEQLTEAALHQVYLQ